MAGALRPSRGRAGADTDASTGHLGDRIVTAEFTGEAP